MNLKVQLFAGLRERAGTGELLLEDLPEALDVAGLKRHLEERFPTLGSLQHVAGVIGTDYAADDARIAEGDEVSLLPPVSGGAPDSDGALRQGVFEIRGEAIDPEACRRRVEHRSCGAVVLFCGNAREKNRGREVERLEYEAFGAMAGEEMRRIFERCVEAHGDAQGDAPERALRMLCVHRSGPVAVGEPSVVIAVASPHRAAAYDASRFLIDALKESLPVWKKEVYEGGAEWIGEGS